MSAKVLIKVVTAKGFRGKLLAVVKILRIFAVENHDKGSPDLFFEV